MSVRIRSIISHGNDGIPVDIECHLANSLPNIVIVGFANKTVDESRERIRGAFSNAGLQLPRKRISINLAPADVPKDSSSLDVPIAVAIMAAADQLPAGPAPDEAYIGELGLDGTIRPVRGIIGKLLSGRRNGVRRFYVPAGNLLQASFIPHIELVPLERLGQLADHFNARTPLHPIRTGEGRRSGPQEPSDDPGAGLGHLDDIIGQAQAKRALQISAAGGHNLLLTGPPGTGKSMLARALASLMPPLTREEMLEVTHLHSLSGRDYDKLITSRPFRAPHHSASHVAVVGGGTMVRPGEVSLAHRGVLLFDEMPEFARTTLEALRQPLEDRTITVSRARESVEYPANFIFVATANPCPCGYYGSSQGCECSPAVINAYRRKLSGPLLDRIDLCVTVDRVEHDRLLETTRDDDSMASIIRLVTEVRQRQAERFGNDFHLNGDMSNSDIRAHALLTGNGKAMLDTAGAQLQLSARAYIRTLKVARTIADLDGSRTIGAGHVAEALQYRSQQVRVR